MVKSKYDVYKPFIKDYCTMYLSKDRFGKNFICPFCGSGSGKKGTSAFSINSKGNYFNCFACGKAGDIFHIHEKLNGCERIDAKKTISDIYGKGLINNFDSYCGNNFKYELPQERKQKQYEYNVLINSTSTANDSNMREFLNDFISFEVIKKFKLRYRYNSFYSKKQHRKIVKRQIVIPVFDEYGNFIGADCRNFADGKDQYKYFPFDRYNFETKQIEYFNMKKAENLFGLYQNKENIISSKEVMIGESQKFVMQACTYGYDNAVGCFGCNLSDYKIMLLKKLKANTIILAFDREFDSEKEYRSEDGVLHKSYSNYMEHICKIANRLYYFLGNIKVYIMTDLTGDYKSGNYLNFKDAPTDKGKGVFYKLYNDKKLITKDVIKKFYKKARW